MGEALTVVQLKSALSAAGVDLPTSNARKKVYVDLYNEHVAVTSKPNARVDESSA